MALSVDQFGKALVTAGLFTADEVKALWNAIPADARPKQGDGFAKLLVQQGKLNQFQADELLSGRNTPLVMGDYVLVAELGAGGMGKVYKARHRRMERIVALKVMSTAAMQDEAAVKRFQREVKAAARLEHPNIVTAYDSGESGKVKYLVMQFVDGGDLSQLVKQNGPLEIERAVDYVLQAARGLGFAHGEGVVHRDIKPANLLLDKKGVVKILDMGLARIEGGDGLTATEQVMGTVDYMSPEQAANTKTADGRSDIYSLGCTLWYLLTAKKLYDGDTMISRLMSHRNDPPPSLVKSRDDVPWSLEQAFHKMIAKSPEERFQSMDEVVAALEPFSPSGGSRPGMGSSIGMGPQNAELASFLKSVGPAVKPQTKPAPTGTKVEVEATAQFAAAGADTDPKSQLLPPSKKAAQPQAKGSGGKSPPNKTMLLAGAGGAALLVLLGVWFIFRDKDGNEVARVQMPEGGSVAVQQPAASGGPAPVATATRPPISFFLPNSTPASPSGTTTMTPGATTLPTVVAPQSRVLRWPLAPSKPPDIVWLQGLAATLTLRNGPDREIELKPSDVPPSDSVTIVGVRFDGGAGAIVTDEVLKRLATLVDLETLSMVFLNEDARATKDGLPQLASLVHLRWLEMAHIGPADTNPKYLEAFQELETLRLEEWILYPWERSVVRLSSLRALELHNLIPENLDELARIPRLASLRLSGSIMQGNQRKAAANRFASFAPWCRITVVMGDRNNTSIVIEPTAPSPSVAAPVAAPPTAAGVVYLDDLTEKSRWGGIRKPGRNPDDAAYLSKAFPGMSPVHALLIDADGTAQDKLKDAVPSTSSHSCAARCVYELAGKYASFQSGLRARKDQLVAEVWGDGRRLWESGGFVPRESVDTTAEVDVRGVRELTLLIWTDTAKYQAEVLLIEPRLTPVTIAAPPPDAAVGNAPPRAVAPFDAATALKHQAAWAQYLGEPVETTNSVGMKLVVIPPGEFLMGEKESQDGQVPVTLTKPFRLGIHEVTREQWRAIMGKDTGFYAADRGENCAANNMNQEEAVEFCQKLTERERTAGRLPADATYRLPTEAEWEWACRAGTTTAYSFGDNEALLGEYALFKGSTGGKPYAWPVGRLKSNRWGLYDMHGNVKERCHDGVQAQLPGGVDPQGLSEGLGRRLRGGDFGAAAASCRTGLRSLDKTKLGKDTGIGFRVALSRTGSGAATQAASSTSVSAPSPAVPSLSTAPSTTTAPPLAKAPFDAAQAKAHQEAWAQYLGEPVETTNSVGMKLVLIPPGEFLMGSSDADITLALKIAEEAKLDERIQEERPQHFVRITQPLRLSVHEVTIGQFAKFIEQANYKTQAEEFGGSTGTVKPEEANPFNLKRTWRTPGNAVTNDSPVTQVSWNDAAAFCNWLSDQEKLTPCYQREGDTWALLPNAKGYRLPTEAEWEYACRAGTATQFWFGDDRKDHDRYGWSNENAGNQPHAVGSLPANPFGLYDMHGNVWEWCHDEYGGYQKSPQDDPLGPIGASNRTQRGGSWSQPPARSRSSSRSFIIPSHRSNDRGFRVALSSVEATTTANVTPPPAVLAASSGKLFMHDPAFPQWLKDVQAMPAEEQIKAVWKKIEELNRVVGISIPKHEIKNGVVTNLGFLTSSVADISPLRALMGLRDLNCDGRTGGRGKLFDLSPLFGMSLTTLSCGNTQVSDLSPLRGMPLTILSCHSTPVSDLSPLHECKNLTSLKIKSTKVTPAAVAALQKALPNCKIEWDDPAKPTPPQPAANGTK